MEEFDFEKYKRMVKEYQSKDDPTGWFDSIYKNVEGDYKAVFWADLEPSEYLVDWIKNNPSEKEKPTAIVIGCGVGDDAEALSKFGYKVIGFDISPNAIKLCKNRYPKTKVDYQVADLFDYPKEWYQNFDLVYECNTIQVLPGQYRIKARKAISNLLAPLGNVLVSCRSRKKGEQKDDIPLPLDKEEISQFVKTDKLQETMFISYNDKQNPPVPHFFAVYKRNL